MAEVSHRHVVAPWLAVRSHRDWWLAIGIPAMVLAFALMWPHLGWWSAGVALAVYGCGYLAYERYQARRALAAQMAAAFGRIAELGSTAVPGHADRSATLAVAVARRLGVDEASLTTVANAARAAHVGRIGLGRPAEARAGFDPVTVAEWSAAILRTAPGLAAAADAVAPVPPHPEDATMGAMRNAVHVASAFDEATCGSGLPADRALEVAAIGAAADAEPALAALGSIFGVRRRQAALSAPPPTPRRWPPAG